MKKSLDVCNKLYYNILQKGEIIMMQINELITTEVSLQRLKELVIKGNRDGWGYDLESINRVIAHIENEIRLAKENK